MPRIAFYTRISTDENHQKYSLDAQKDRLEAYCKSQYDEDWSLHKTYRDTESGTHMNRPGLEEMLYDASVEAFDVLLVFRADRLSRKVRDLKARLEELNLKCNGLEEQREWLALPEMDREFLRKTLGAFEEVMATAENAKKEAPSPLVGEEGADS